MFSCEFWEIFKKTFFLQKTSGRLLLFFVSHNLLFCSESGQLWRFEFMYSTVQIVGWMSGQMSMLSRKWFELGNLHHLHILLDMSILMQLENIFATIEIIFRKNISQINLFNTYILLIQHWTFTLGSKHAYAINHWNNFAWLLLITCEHTYKYADPQKHKHAYTNKLQTYL